MLHKICPHCQRKLRLTDCLGLIYHAYDTCIYCQKPYQVKRKVVHLNAAIGGTIIGVLGRAVADLSYFACALTGFFFGIFIQRFIDFWHELEPADDDVLK